MYPDQKGKKILITGGPGSGKSTLINALKARGFLCVEEVARRIIKEQLGLGTQLVPWVNLTGYSELVFRNNVELVRSAPADQTVFFDRGAPDVIAYLRSGQCEIPAFMLRDLAEVDYHPVAFITPPWKAIYQNDQERRESYEAGEKVFEFIRSTYIELGFALIEIPKGHTNKRARFILDRI